MHSRKSDVQRLLLCLSMPIARLWEREKTIDWCACVVLSFCQAMSRRRRDQTHQPFPVTCCERSNFRFRSLSWTVPCGEWCDVGVTLKSPWMTLTTRLSLIRIDDDYCVQFPAICSLAQYAVLDSKSHYWSRPKARVLAQNFLGVLLWFLDEHC